MNRCGLGFLNLMTAKGVHSVDSEWSGVVAAVSGEVAGSVQAVEAASLEYFGPGACFGLLCWPPLGCSLTDSFGPTEAYSEQVPLGYLLEDFSGHQIGCCRWIGKCFVGPNQGYSLSGLS